MLIGKTEHCEYLVNVNGGKLEVSTTPSGKWRARGDVYLKARGVGDTHLGWKSFVGDATVSVRQEGEYYAVGVEMEDAPGGDLDGVVGNAVLLAIDWLREKAEAVEAPDGWVCEKYTKKAELELCEEWCGGTVCAVDDSGRVCGELSSVEVSLPLDEEGMRKKIDDHPSLLHIVVSVEAGGDVYELWATPRRKGHKLDKLVFCIGKEGKALEGVIRGIRQTAGEEGDGGYMDVVYKAAVVLLEKFRDSLTAAFVDDDLRVQTYDDFRQRMRTAYNSPYNSSYSRYCRSGSRYCRNGSRYCRSGK